MKIDIRTNKVYVSVPFGRSALKVIRRQALHGWGPGSVLVPMEWSYNLLFAICSIASSDSAVPSPNQQ